MAEHTPKMNEDFYYELIAKELSGEISEAESTTLLEWVNKEEGNRMFYEVSKKNWKSVDVKEVIPDFDTEAAWNKLKSRTTGETAIEKEGKKIPLNSLSSTFKMAAAVLFLVGVFSLLKITMFSDPEAIDIASGINKVELYLPDSSKVILNKNSHLTYYTDFNSEGRKVYLEGEAFFEVKKSQGKKFEVYGIRSVTTVLGTSFSVRSVKNEKEIVQVVTGKVSLADLDNREKNQILLTPGLRGELDQSSALSIHEIKDPNFMAWRQERLTFDNTELSAVAETLEEYFGLEIEVTDPLLLTCRFTGSFDKPKPDEILEVLAVSTNSSYKVAGNKITLSGKGCSQK